MARMSRRGLLFGLGFAAAGLGCGGMNPFLLPYMFSGGQTKTPAEFPLTPHAKKVDAKVVVLASSKMGLPPGPGRRGPDAERRVDPAPDARVKENEEKVQVLKMPRIDEYKSEHPNWRAAHPYDVGREVADGVDYLIDVEINEMDLYKPGSRGQWLLGHANVSVNAYDLSKPLREPGYKQDMVFQYPHSEIEVESRAQVSAFRLKFVQRMAFDISMKFAASTPVRRMD